MFWLIPVGIGVAVVSAIIVTLENEAGTQQTRWQENHRQTQQKMVGHRQNLTAHLQTAQQSYQFHTLVNAHYASMQTANEAYLLLRDAEKSIAAVNTALGASKQQIANLSAQRNTAKPLPQDQRLCTEIDGLRQLRNALFVQKKTLIQQKDSFLTEVKQLNNQTRELKESIRQQTGSRGEEWYRKMEMRKTCRQLTN
jgi:hypothetical protein